MKNSVGLLIIIDHDLTIKEVIYNTLIPEQIVGKSLLDFFIPEDHIKLTLFSRSIFAGNTDFTWDVSLKNDESIKTVVLSGVKQEDQLVIIGSYDYRQMVHLLDELTKINNEQVNQYHIALKEISRAGERASQTEFQTLDELAKLNNEFANLQRTIIKQNVELLRSNQDLDQFAYAISHDLIEPLRTMKGFITLLKKRYYNELGETGNEYIDFALDSSNRMSEMIDGLLTFSRIGRKEESYKKLSGNAVVEKVLRNLNKAINESNAHIEVESLPEIFAEENQLIQVFQNLIANAIKYCQERRPEIKIAAEEGKTDWIFSVSDNGIGIHQKDQERIFQIFQRLHTREEFDGIGMGLSITRKIIERFGGQIWVESQPGKGSIFSFSIPKRHNEAP